MIYSASKVSSTTTTTITAAVTTPQVKPDPSTCTTCGYSKYSDAGRIGGNSPASHIAEGWYARPHEFPYQVCFAFGILSIYSKAHSFE